MWEGLKSPPFPTAEQGTQAFPADSERNTQIPAPVKKAKQLLTAHLAQHRPGEPLIGAVELRTIWLFPKGKSHKNGEWRVTKPDTDNLQKLLKDCMTKCGFWKDDAQVVREVVEKRWSDEPTGIYIEITDAEVSP